MKAPRPTGTFYQSELGDVVGLVVLALGSQLKEWHFEEEQRAVGGSWASGTGGASDNASGEQSKKSGITKKVVQSGGPSAGDAATGTNATKDYQK